MTNSTNLQMSESRQNPKQEACVKLWKNHAILNLLKTGNKNKSLKVSQIF